MKEIAAMLREEKDMIPKDRFIDLFNTTAEALTRLGISPLKEEVINTVHSPSLPGGTPESIARVSPTSACGKSMKEIAAMLREEKDMTPMDCLIGLIGLIDLFNTTGEALIRLGISAPTGEAINTVLRPSLPGIRFLPGVVVYADSDSEDESEGEPGDGLMKGTISPPTSSALPSASPESSPVLAPRVEIPTVLTDAQPLSPLLTQHTSSVRPVSSPPKQQTTSQTLPTHEDMLQVSMDLETPTSVSTLNMLVQEIRALRASTDTLVSVTRESERHSQQRHEESTALLRELIDVMRSSQDSSSQSPQKAGKKSQASSSGSAYYYQSLHLSNVVSVLACILSQLESLLERYASSHQVLYTSEGFTSFKDLRYICEQIYKVPAAAVGIADASIPQFRSNEMMIAARVVGSEDPNHGTGFDLPQLQTLIEECPHVMGCVENIRQRLVACDGLISPVQRRLYKSVKLPYVKDNDLNVDIKVLHQKDTWGDSAIKGLKISERTGIAMRMLGGEKVEDAVLKTFC
jgi:hypothetical protein